MSLATINTALEGVTGTSGELVENLGSLTRQVVASYNAVRDMGGQLPQHLNTSNLASAIEGI